MSKFFFVLTRGSEDPTRAVRCFQFAKVAAEKGHDVKVFLADDAAFLCNMMLAERVKAPTGDELLPYMKYLQEKNVPILVCKPCAGVRLVGEDDMPSNFRLATAYDLIEIAENSKVFSF
ncbi:MAG: DsrE family protein [Desulfococcaceae bacterium]